MTNTGLGLFIDLNLSRMRIIKGIVLLFVILVSLFSFGQEVRPDDSDSIHESRNEHHVFLEGAGSGFFYSFGYEYKYKVNPYFYLGTGIGTSITPKKAPSTQWMLIPKLFIQGGKNWWFLETGFEQNILINFYAIVDQSKYFNCPYGHCIERFEFYYIPYVGTTFKIREKHELGIAYKPLIIPKTNGYTQHWFGVKYRFRFK